MPSPAERPALAVMAKPPRAGLTKTRLCPPLTASQAAGLYAAFVEDVLQAASAVPGLHLAVAVTPQEGLGYFEERVPPGTGLLSVAGATIGRCLDTVLTGLLAQGHMMAGALASDCPTVQPALIARGFERLRDADVVLSPGDDGGYYFIAVKAPHPELFTDEMPWSTPQVLAHTLARARDLGLAVDLIAPLMDVDTPADLERLRRELARLPADVARRTRLALEGLQ